MNAEMNTAEATPANDSQVADDASDITAADIDSTLSEQTDNGTLDDNDSMTNDLYGGETAKPEGQEPDGTAKITPEWIERIQKFSPETDISDPAAVQEAVWNMYRNLEKEYTPLSQEYKQAKEQLSSLSSAKEIIDWINQDPKRAEQVTEFFEELRQEEVRKRYGEDLPNEVLNELEEARRTKAKVESLERERQEAAEDAKLEAAIKSAEKFAQEKGIQFNEKEVLDYMQENGVYNPLTAFKAMQFEQAVLESKQKGAKETLQKIQQNKKNGIIGLTPGNNQPSPKNLGGLSEGEWNDSIYADVEAMLANK